MAIQTPQALISLEQVDKKFVLSTETVHALKSVSFSIPKESFSIIYGPSGSGKSTLLNTMVGLEPPTAGRVVIEGQDLYSLNSDQRANFRARTLGMVYQTNYWVNSLTVLENVCMPLFLAGYSKRQAISVALDSLTMVGMADFTKKRPTVLSGGQQQRVSMARAIVANPELIVADEPTGNLDTKNGDMIMNLLSDLNHKLHKTIILVTHNLEYLSLSTHRVQIKDGTVVEDAGIYGLTPKQKKERIKRLQESFTQKGGPAKSNMTIAEMQNQLAGGDADEVDSNESGSKISKVNEEKLQSKKGLVDGVSKKKGHKS
ncbi:ABC transporter ATP-binding protein [bacterium]|nr:MAG: ABC transporter ATP-binding protein [bacterium]